MSSLAAQMATAAAAEIPEALAKRLTEAILERCPEARIQTGQGKFEAKHGTMKFTVHGRSKTGEVSPRTYQKEGPNFRGFMLSVSLEKGRYQGAAVVPQTLREPYFQTYIDAVPTEDGQQHYWVTFSQGGRLDDTIKQALFAALPKRRFAPAENERATTALEPLPNVDRPRPRARDIGIDVGLLPTGPRNAITDVEGVRVGHRTLRQGENVRTGVTVIVPHDGNLFQEKVPAAICLGNAFGKLAGYTQVEELGTLETPIALTNTLSVPVAMQALIRATLNRPGNERVRSVNAVVGETNDGGLNDIRGMHVTETDVELALETAAGGEVQEGNVGAGTGTVCFGFKGGIGTASRRLPEPLGGYTVGVLVQSNFGGVLTINGAPVGRELGRFPLKRFTDMPEGEGSCMVVVATDAPLTPRNLKRLAKRALLGLGRTGSSLDNGSGDYVIAFSTAYRIPHRGGPLEPAVATVANASMSRLFMAVVEATEEAVYNSLFKATTEQGRQGSVVEAIPIDRVLEICQEYGVLHLHRRLPPVRLRAEED